MTEKPSDKPKLWAVEHSDRLFTYSPDKAAPAAGKADWLWEPYLARGTVAILDGDPGVGKSFLAIDLAARLSSGQPMPDGTPCRPTRDRGGKEMGDFGHTTVVISAEDSITHTLLPRFDAAGGRRDGIHFLGGLLDGANPGRVSLPRDFPALVSTIGEFWAALVVIDPMMAVFDPTVSTNNDQQVREVLSDLAEIAAVNSACILLVRHLNKSGTGKSLYRGSGSIGIVGAARTALLAGKHPEDPDRRVLTMTKNNLGRLGPSLAYRLVELPAREVPCVYDRYADDPEDYGVRTHLAAAGTGVVWDGPTPVTADDLCRDFGDAGASRSAADWLTDLLANGPVPATEVETAAHKAGFGFTTIKAVKGKLKVDSKRVPDPAGGMRWVWLLPPATGQGAKGGAATP